jgi:general secretion pathway protein C
MTRRIPSLLNLLLLAALAATCTYWVLQIASVQTLDEPIAAAPEAESVARAQPADMGPVARLFGASSAPAPSRIRLSGVIAVGGKGAGVALLSMDGEPPIAYRAGEAIDAHLTLAEVRADRVLIRTQTGIQEVRLPERSAPAGIMPAR